MLYDNTSYYVGKDINMGKVDDHCDKTGLVRTS